MRSAAVIRLAILVALITGVAVGGVAGLLLVTRGTTTTESAVTVLRKSQAAQAQLLAPLGPNTTYHLVTVQHREQSVTDLSGFTAPNDTTTDLFMTFDGTGVLFTFWQVTRGADNQIYGRADWLNDTLVFTNTRTGEKRVVSYPRIPATAIGERLSQSVSKAIQEATSTSASSDAVAGIPAYAIESTTNRTYIDKSDYHVLKSEQIAPDGHVTEYTMQTTQEVLLGIVTAPTPLAVP